LSKVVRYVSGFIGWQLSCSTMAALPGKLLPQRGVEATQCCAAPVPGDKLSDLTCPHSRRRLASCPIPTLRVHLLNAPCSQDELSSLSMAFSFVQGRVQSDHELYWIMFPGRNVVCGSHLLGLQIHTSGVGPKLVQRNGKQIFPRQTLVGAVPGPSRLGACRPSVGHGSAESSSV
jgi:hypothetical protein